MLNSSLEMGSEFSGQTKGNGELGVFLGDLIRPYIEKRLRTEPHKIRSTMRHLHARHVSSADSVYPSSFRA